MSSEKRPKQDVPQGASNREDGGSIRREDGGSIRREDDGSIEIEARDLFSAWEPPQSHEPSERRSQPQLPPSLPPLPDESAPSAEAEIAPLTFSNDVSSLAPTVREQPARAPERRGSLRPLLMGLLAFAAAGALWIGLPHPEVSRMLAPHAATAGVVDHEPGVPIGQTELAPANANAANANAANANAANANSAAVAVAPVNDAPAAPSIEAAPANPIVVPAVTIDRAPAATPARVHAPRRSKRVISSSGPLPDVPRREDVIGALNQLRGQLKSCSAGRSGVAEIDLTIAGNGAVTNALIGGDFAGTPQGSCLARAIRAAHFEPFAQPRSRILYRMAL